MERLRRVSLVLLFTVYSLCAVFGCTWADKLATVGTFTLCLVGFD